MMKKLKNKKGFTFIEIIIVIVVLSLGIVTMLDVFDNVMRFSVQPEVLNVGTHLAEQEMERIASSRYSDVVSVGATNFAAPFDDYTSQITVSAVPVALAVDPLMTEYKQVEVIIGHPQLNADVTWTTIITNN